MHKEYPKKRFEKKKRHYNKLRDNPVSGLNQMYRLLAGRLFKEEGIPLENIATNISIWIQKHKEYRMPAQGTVLSWRVLFNLFDERGKIMIKRKTKREAARYFMVYTEENWRNQIDEEDYRYLRQSEKVTSYSTAMIKQLEQKQRIRQDKKVRVTNDTTSRT